MTSYSSFFSILSLSFLFSFPDLGDAYKDGEIECAGELPPGKYGNLEYYRSQKTSADFPGGIDQFCIREPGVQNMAAYCRRDVWGVRVEIDEMEMDMSLYNTVTYNWCRDRCFCSAREREEKLALLRIEQAKLAEQMAERLAGLGISSSPPFSWASSDTNTWDKRKSSCFKNGDCNGGRRNCVLMPEKNNLQLGLAVGMVWTSHCVKQHRRPSLNGRDELSAGEKREATASYPCACNATYVSGACCETVTGLVYKKEGNELGRGFLN